MYAEDPLHVHDLPDLREPVILAAFAGWNDAAQVATHALTTLVDLWSAQRFAEIDPEPFYSFTDTRPTINIGPAGRRSLHWPSNHFFGHRLADNERDVVVLRGTEPNLHWRSFCRTVLSLADQVGASCLVTLGGLLADVPHTVEPRLTGFASAPRLLPQLRQLGVQMSSYEGPTGIIGALHHAWGGADRPAISLWGNVPHYISATPNPQVSLALLRRVSGLLGIDVPLAALERQAGAFRTQVDEALRANPDAQTYVRQLEQQLENETPPEPAPKLIDELEEFLRSRRPPSEDPPQV